MSRPSPSPSSALSSRRRALVAAAVLGLALTACGQSGGDEVGAGAPAGADEAGAGAGGLVGGVVKEGGSDDGGEETTTTSTEAPPSSETTAPPATTAPTTVRTTPPQTSPPQTTTQTFQTTTPKATPNVIGADALGGDQRQVYDAIGGGKQVEGGLTRSAQDYASARAASGSGIPGSNNLYAETGFPWGQVYEITGQGPDLSSVINSLSGQAGSIGGYSHIGVGVAQGADGYYVSVRVGRQ